MQQKQDIINIDDIKKLVNTFYEKVRKDDLIGPIFNYHINEDWAAHMDKMYRFWQTVLLEELTYFGSPFPPHTKMDIDHKHFQRWLSLFLPTVDALFEGTKATEIKWRASKMAELFESKLKHFKQQGFKNLL
jgi:hemoglobin